SREAGDKTCLDRITACGHDDRNRSVDLFDEACEDRTAAHDDDIRIDATQIVCDLGLTVRPPYVTVPAILDHQIDAFPIANIAQTSAESVNTGLVSRFGIRRYNKYSRKFFCL